MELQKHSAFMGLGKPESTKLRTQWSFLLKKSYQINFLEGVKNHSDFNRASLELIITG